RTGGGRSSCPAGPACCSSTPGPAAAVPGLPVGCLGQAAHVSGDCWSVCPLPARRAADIIQTCSDRCRSGRARPGGPERVASPFVNQRALHTDEERETSHADWPAMRRLLDEPALPALARGCAVLGTGRGG